MGHHRRDRATSNPIGPTPAAPRAHDSDDPHRSSVRLDALSGDTRLGHPWLSLLAFLRIATHPSLFPRPLSVTQALEIVDLWCDAPNVVHPEPSRAFAATFARTTRSGSAPGNLVHDAYLAALALEHGASVATFDRDFVRFTDVDVVVPGVHHDTAR